MGQFFTFFVYLFPGSNFFMFMTCIYCLSPKKTSIIFFWHHRHDCFTCLGGIFLGGSNFLITYPQCYDNQSFCFWNHSICFANHISEFPEKDPMLKKKSYYNFSLYSIIR